MTSESGIPNAAPAAESKTPAGEAPQAATEAVEALQDRLLRALADAENARRQAERARSEGRRAGVADLIARLASRNSKIAVILATPDAVAMPRIAFASSTSP